MTAAHKYICDCCGSHIEAKDVLSAPNPFEKSEVISGCPNCKAVDQLSVACDQAGCWKPYSVGQPSSDGYKLLCHYHSHLWQAQKP